MSARPDPARAGSAQTARPPGIRVELTTTEPLRGSVVGIDGATTEFAGWLGLLATLASAIDALGPGRA